MRPKRVNDVTANNQHVPWGFKGTIFNHLTIKKMRYYVEMDHNHWIYHLGVPKTAKILNH